MSLADRGLRLLMRQAWRRGVVGSNPVWAAVGGAAVLGYLTRKALRREPDVVFREDLAPGESIRVTHERRA